MDLEAIEASLKAAAGKVRTTGDVITAAVAERLSVTLEAGLPAPAKGQALPPGWHTMFCLQAPPRSSLGVDGLPTLFDQIPAVPMQRRMFGGARMTFHAPLLVGEDIRCESEMGEAKVRSSPSAHMVIVTLRHRYYGSSGLAVTEEQDVVHLEPLGGAAEKPASAPEAMPQATWTRTVTPDPIMLFRFSALTFNSHRIHYDAPYSANEEKLPALMVQGKLIALQILETVRKNAPAARPQRFEYRSGRPLFADAPFTTSALLEAGGEKARLWAADSKGRTVQTASMTFAAPVEV